MTLQSKLHTITYYLEELFNTEKQCTNTEKMQKALNKPKQNMLSREQEEKYEHFWLFKTAHQRCKNMAMLYNVVLQRSFTIIFAGQS